MISGWGQTAGRMEIDSIGVNVEDAPAGDCATCPRDRGGHERRVHRECVVPPADHRIHVIVPQREAKWHSFPCDARGA